LGHLNVSVSYLSDERTLHNMQIIFEDNHILVVVKPIGIPVQEDQSGESDFLNIIKEYRRVHENKPGNVFVGLVHRLDRMVGGIMIFAKTSKAASRLSEQIRLQKLTKTYLAIVEDPNLPGGELKDWLVKDSNTNTSRVVQTKANDAKEAILRYQVLERKEDLSLLHIHLITGRSHQIRVQFSSRSWPLLGDHRYGKPNTIQKSPALWSHSLTIEHPTTKETLTFYAPHPNGDYWKRFSVLSKRLEFTL
jgi:23S rRNA pseudouridine1911/1915/1917 synthase